MITNRDLADIPVDVGRERTAPGRLELTAREVDRLAECSLDPVLRVMMRLLARSAAADPATRVPLLADVDELEAALRVAREVIFPRRCPDIGRDGPATDRIQDN